MKTADNIKFNKEELAGSFGDIGTDLPLIVGMISAVNLDSGSVFIMFGIMQIFSGLIYGLPMPLQPLKAMAVLVISEKIPPNILFGGGLSIALIMILLTVTGSLHWLGKLIPLCVVRGIQCGLGLSLASLALKNYIPSDGIQGYILALVALGIMVIIPKSSLIPAGLLVIGVGIIYSFFFHLQIVEIIDNIGFSLPQPHQPTISDIATGFVILALPQLPLSLSNSVIATHQTVKDFFPDSEVSLKKIGFTYTIANMIMPFFSGIPVCHGCGGLAGHYSLGGRTGGSVIIYGLMYLIIGLFFSAVFTEVVAVFPLPILGIVLLFEALTLLLFMADQSASQQNLMIAFLVAVIAFSIPQGYLIGLVIGTLIYYGKKSLKEEAVIKKY